MWIVTPGAILKVGLAILVAELEMVWECQELTINVVAKAGTHEVTAN